MIVQCQADFIYQLLDIQKGSYQNDPDNYNYKPSAKYNVNLPTNILTRITLFCLSKASDLAAMDNNGLSDPFVEIVLHKDLVLKSKVINKSINPVWNEKFTLYIDDRSALANIHVSS